MKFKILSLSIFPPLWIRFLLTSITDQRKSEGLFPRVKQGLQKLRKVQYDQECLSNPEKNHFSIYP
jgi:hypothetical protein